MNRHAVGALVAASLLLLILAGPALSHAELEESDPADGETIETPYTLTATFSEEFDPDPQRSFILVEDSAGDEVARGGVSDDDPTMMSVDLPELQPGEYLVRWQTRTIDDGGVENDTFTFIVAAPTPAPTANPTPTSVPTPSRPAASQLSPTQGPAPTATPISPIGKLPTAGNDVLLALVLAGVVIGGIALFLFARSRR